MTRKPRSHVRIFNISNVGFCYPDTGGHFLRILSDNCNESVQRYLHKLHADGNHGCRWCIHRYLNNTGSKKQKKMNFSFFFHRADQWPFRVNNGLQSLLLKCYEKNYSFTWTISPVSSETQFTDAIIVSSGINASCILMAIMASDAAFIDIWSVSNRRKTRKK